MPRLRLPLAVTLLLAVLAAGLVPAAADAAKRQPRVFVPETAAGAKTMVFRYGPLHVVPGQNTIELKPNAERPKVSGYITRFKPDLVYADGTKVRRGADGKAAVPRVDVIHLHHGVWVINGRPTFAAGEEKTIANIPAGFGYRYKTTDSWLMNYMIHNLTPNPDAVFIQYTIDFVPDTAPEAATMTAVDTKWLEATGNKGYPVFDALRKDADEDGKLVYPDGLEDPYDGGPAANEWLIDKDRTIVQAGGHLHPGGLDTFLTVTRGGVTRRIFTSKAFYWEPAGAVSWDVAMTTTPSAWKVALKAGDLVKVHGTYDVSKASWYESMVIMPIAVTAGPAGGMDPFATDTDVPGVLTHGQLPENAHHGGETQGLPDPAKLLNGPVAKGMLTIDGYVTSQGDLSAGTTKAGRLPTASYGTGISFVNLDATKAMTPDESAYHTITACKLPCNKVAGIAYPLADGPVDFDSGELGYGPVPFTAAANRNTWTTPKGLKPGTYTYFCRIHPFMRGAFRVTPKAT